MPELLDVRGRAPAYVGDKEITMVRVNDVKKHLWQQNRLVNLDVA